MVYEGFVRPITSNEAQLSFANLEVSSVPYGTGISICCKNLIQHVFTRETQYVQATDLTLSGSRSRANAISVWMLLQASGPNG